MKRNSKTLDRRDGDRFGWSGIYRVVSQYLHGKNWDTRVAAAHAIGAIAGNVKHTTLTELYSCVETKMSEAGISGIVEDVVAWPDFDSKIVGACAGVYMLDLSSDDPFSETKDEGLEVTVKREREIDLNMQVPADEIEPNLKRPKVEDSSSPLTVTSKIISASRDDKFDASVKVQDSERNLSAAPTNGELNFSSVKIEPQSCIDSHEDPDMAEAKGSCEDNCSMGKMNTLKSLPENCVLMNLVKVTRHSWLKIRRPEWEVRHGSLLGIKYLVAVRQLQDTPMVFDLDELHFFTEDFSHELGQGGFGKVYKGKFFEQNINQLAKQEIAVKVSKDSQSETRKIWMAEVQFLSICSHPNVIRSHMLWISPSLDMVTFSSTIVITIAIEICISLPLLVQPQYPPPSVPSLFHLIPLFLLASHHLISPTLVSSLFIPPPPTVVEPISLQAYV
ncbi:TATA-binding protein-associated factor BTAF1 [Camellia lanceoleosa]|uniref:TATA-binding protein-associated factor BTAF1 n=1 Tax=Camellia lanceoleosa TaxID=1840588 RepID=A0ACC0FLH4_9ERIC|nr:TATA-binding protein-associated factor BTAF1 [Camellia lanceoleosa]